VGIALKPTAARGRLSAELRGAWNFKPYRGKPAVRNFRGGGWRRGHGSRTEAQPERAGTATGPYRARASAPPDSEASAGRTDRGKHAEHIEVRPHVHGTQTDSHGDPSGMANLSADEPDALMRARPDLRVITPPLSQSLDPTEPHTMDQWDQEKSTDVLLAKRCSVHRLAPFRGCPELPQPLSLPPVGPDDPQAARRNLPRANPATKRPVSQLVR